MASSAGASGSFRSPARGSPASPMNTRRPTASPGIPRAHPLPGVCRLPPTRRRSSPARPLRQPVRLRRPGGHPQMCAAYRGRHGAWASGVAVGRANRQGRTAGHDIEGHPFRRPRHGQSISPFGAASPKDDAPYLGPQHGGSVDCSLAPLAIPAVAKQTGGEPYGYASPGRAQTSCSATMRAHANECAGSYSSHSVPSRIWPDGRFTFGCGARPDRQEDCDLDQHS
jgi:hypothetical protein